MAESLPPNLTNNKWLEMTLAEQLGNIGSEVGRALNWQKKGQTELKQKATDRALELLDKTIADQRWKKRLKEIIRSREGVADYFYGQNEFKSTPEQLEKYFYWFAVEARKNV